MAQRKAILKLNTPFEEEFQFDFDAIEPTIRNLTITGAKTIMGITTASAATTYGLSKLYTRLEWI